MPNHDMDRIYVYIDNHVDQFIDELKPLLSQPSISAQGIGIRETALLLRRMMEKIGIKTELIETAGSPVIIGEMTSPHGAETPTVLVYGHYDVQPPEPLDAWVSPPFQPTIRNGRIYARGAGDNKGQLFAQLMAVRTHLHVNGRVPINVKFVIEGEEESSSPNLERFVSEHKELLKSDFVYTSDGPVHESGRPIVVLGVRGILYVELTATGANRDLHSGNWGGPIPNPAWLILDLLQTMKDPSTGRILIDGFYDKIRSPTEDERNALRRIPLDRRKVAKDIGLREDQLPSAEEFYERLMFHPTLNICGFASGYMGKGSKTIVPSSATVKMDMRLVADQNPDDIFRKFLMHVKQQSQEIEVKHLGQMRPSRTPLDSKFAKPIIESVKQATEEDPLVFPSLGGSLPDYVFTGILGVPSIMVPYANIDENNHAPNENLAVKNFVRGVKCFATVLDRLSTS